MVPWMNEDLCVEWKREAYDASVAPNKRNLDAWAFWIALVDPLYEVCPSRDNKPPRGLDLESILESSVYNPAAISFTGTSFILWI